MRIIVAAVGRLKRGPETELSERYAKRAAQTGRPLGLRAIDIIEIRESRAAEADKRRLEESIALANVIPQGAAVVPGGPPIRVDRSDAVTIPDVHTPTR